MINNFPNKVVAFCAFMMNLKNNNKYKKIIPTAPTKPYSSTMMAKMKSEED